MISRRSFLKISGTLALGAWLSPVNCLGHSPGVADSGFAMIIDLQRCMGCEACVIACKATYKTPRGTFNTRVKTMEVSRGEGQWMEAFLPTLCHQCQDPPCMRACPKGAIYIDDTGIVITDWERCSGEGLCLGACPVGARYLDPSNGMRSGKCDFCIERLKVGRQPICVETCPSRARLFGRLDRPTGEFATYLRERVLYTISIPGPRRGRVFYAGYKSGPFGLSRV